MKHLYNSAGELIDKYPDKLDPKTEKRGGDN